LSDLSGALSTAIMAAAVVISVVTHLVPGNASEAE